jgi:hypothetical protein
MFIISWKTATFSLYSDTKLYNVSKSFIAAYVWEKNFSIRIAYENKSPKYIISTNLQTKTRNHNHQHFSTE